MMREAAKSGEMERIGSGVETTAPKAKGAVKPSVPIARVGQALAPEEIVPGAPAPVYETERGSNCVIVVAVNGVYV